MARLRVGDIGSISAWLPSRRSVESQRGARVMLFVGQVRSGRSTGLNGDVPMARHAARLLADGCYRRICAIA